VSSWAGYSFYNLRTENRNLRTQAFLLARLRDLQRINSSYSDVRFETFPEAFEYFSKLLCAVEGSEQPMRTYLEVVEEVSRRGDRKALHAMICDACVVVHKLLDGIQGQDSAQCQRTAKIVIFLLDSFGKMVKLVRGTSNDPDHPILTEAQNLHQVL
jgi:hypothetical protein